MAAIVLAILAFVALALVVAGIASPRAADEVEARLIQYGERPMNLEELELARPFNERVLLPLLKAVAQFMSRFTPQRSLEATRRNP